MALASRILSRATRQVYTGPAILQSEYAAPVRLFATAPPATKGNGRPPTLKGDEMLKNIFLDVKKKFETAIGVLRKEKITIDPEDPAAVSEYAKVMKTVREKAKLFSESERIKYTIVTRTAHIEDVRTHMLALKEIRINNRSGKRMERNCNATVNTSFYHSKSLIHGELPCLRSLQGPLSTYYARPLYNCFQHMGFTSSRILLANISDETPIPSPLTPQLALTSGKDEANEAVTTKPSKVQAVLKKIKQSPKKVNLVAALVRGMRVEDALLQLQVTVKRASKTVYQVIHSARANATNNHGLDPDRLLIAEAHVGKGFFKKRINYHARGKCGIKVRPECRLTVVVREITPEEEAEIARLRVKNFVKLSKRERQLVPHKLIETTPIWDRKGKAKLQS